jgi:cell division protein FtsB
MGICIQVQYLRSHVGLFAAISCVVAVLGAFTMFERKGVARLGELHEWKRTLTDRAFRLLQENNDLSEQIMHFHQDDHHLEKLARDRLGLVRDREIVYRFPDADGTDDPG